MPYSHHSHSGEFCNHAVDTLEDVIEEAIRQGMQTYALTEHMPRNQIIDLYPGEQESGWSIPEQAQIYDRFYHKARQLQKQYEGRIELLIGIEIDWIRAESQDWIETLLRKYQLDLFVGSVHHVYGIPIDFDLEHYKKAMEIAGRKATQDTSPEIQLFQDYFDDQFLMLKSLKPPVVGHLDLIRLLSENRDVSWETYPTVWERIKRNLSFIAEYDGLLELNGAALRKGLEEPYPKLEICSYFNSVGGRFVFSDDSHGIKQVGHSYKGLLEHVRQAGVTSLAVLTRTSNIKALDERFLGIACKEVSIENVTKLDFWLR